MIGRGPFCRVEHISRVRLAVTPWRSDHFSDRSARDLGLLAMMTCGSGWQGPSIVVCRAGWVR